MSDVKKMESPSQWFRSDGSFDLLYPEAIRLLAPCHWTPLAVTRLAAGFLAQDKGAKVLDIGSGVGKFCLAAAHYRPEAFFIGVEQRKELVNYSEAARLKMGVFNACFLHRNFTQIDFADYDHFYFYNSFYENLAFANRIDERFDYSEALYEYYHGFLYSQLQFRPPGTRVAAFHSLEYDMPAGYHLTGEGVNGLLKFWIKL